SNNRIAETVDPLTGLPCASGTYGSPSLFPIPTPTQTPLSAGYFLLLPSTERQMAIYNGTICKIEYTNTPDEAGHDQVQNVQVTFTPSAANVIISWGGHIAREHDWGQGNGATGISGSPYHTHLGGPLCQYPTGTCVSPTGTPVCDNIGSQDMQL